MSKKINARQKGNAYERKIAQEFRELGYKDCSTSRLESKKRDDMGVDLVNTGMFNIQCKAVERLGLHHTIIDKMPNEKDKINLIFHKVNRKGEVVTMTKESFYFLLNLINKITDDM